MGLESGVSKEVRGDSGRDLAEATRALREVVKKHKAPAVAESHLLLHNYADSIWAQLLKRMHNGLGKTVELDYATLSQVMTEAATANRPWSTASPLPRK